MTSRGCKRCFPTSSSMDLQSLWLEFELWQSEDGAPPFDPENDFCNIKAVVDGKNYYLNIWTFKFAQNALAEETSSGSSHLLPPDLLVARLDRALIGSAIRTLIRNNQLQEAWRLPGHGALDDSPDATERR